MPQQFLHLIEAAAGVSKVAAESVPELMRVTPRASLARRPAAAISAPTASGRIGAPTAPRNKLTSKKSLACASGTPNRSNS